MRTLRKLATCVSIALSLSGAGAFADAPTHGVENPNATWGAIDGRGLEALQASQVQMKIVDARGDKYFDGNLIVGAKRLPADASEDAIKKTLPNKKGLVVVYCGGVTCPASGILAERLVSLGYTSVIDYHGGIKEWMALKKPIEKISENK